MSALATTIDSLSLGLMVVIFTVITAILIVIACQKLGDALELISFARRFKLWFWDVYTRDCTHVPAPEHVYVRLYLGSYDTKIMYRWLTNEMADWVRDNMPDRCGFMPGDDPVLWFKDPNDALMFKMRWF